MMSTKSAANPMAETAIRVYQRRLLRLFTVCGCMRQTSTFPGSPDGQPAGIAQPTIRLRIVAILQILSTETIVPPDEPAVKRGPVDVFCGRA